MNFPSQSEKDLKMFFFFFFLNVPKPCRLNAVVIIFNYIHCFSWLLFSARRRKDKECCSFCFLCFIYSFMTFLARCVPSFSLYSAFLLSVTFGYSNLYFFVLRCFLFHTDLQTRSAEGTR